MKPMRRIGAILSAAFVLVGAVALPPLVDAAKQGDLAALRALIESGADVNARNRLGWTPLMVAGGLYIANAHKISPESAEILRQAMAARDLPTTR